MLLSDFHRLRIDAEDCSSLDEYITEQEAAACRRNAILPTAAETHPSKF